MKRITMLTMILASLACSGRDPRVTERNDRALAKAHGDDGDEGEGEGPSVRRLTSKKLFGTLPVQDRFLDPLFTLGGNGWYAVSADFQRYAVFHVRAIPTPTQTPAIEFEDGNDNQQGVVLVGAYKGSRAREGVSVWLGRQRGDTQTFDSVTVSVIGSFVPGGEQSVDLTAEEGSTVTAGDVAWTRFSVVMEQGPVGWANLYVQDETVDKLFVAGAVAEDLPPAGANASIRVATPRALTDHERATLTMVHDRMRDQLGHAPASAPQLRPL